MSARDELAAELWKHHYEDFTMAHDGRESSRCQCGALVYPNKSLVQHQAEVALAHLRKTVTTPEQLDALPEGTLFRSGDRLGRLWAHSASALDGGHVWADNHDALPLEVLA